MYSLRFHWVVATRYRPARKPVTSFYRLLITNCPSENVDNHRTKIINHGTRVKVSNMQRRFSFTHGQRPTDRVQKFAQVHAYSDDTSSSTLVFLFNFRRVGERAAGMSVCQSAAAAAVSRWVSFDMFISRTIGQHAALMPDRNIRSSGSCSANHQRRAADALRSAPVRSAA